MLLDYGGGFGTMPSFTADYFGTKYMGVNYGWILLAWGVGGIVGPIFVAVVKDRTGTFSGALPVIAVMLLVAAILPIVTHKPTRSAPVRSTGGCSAGPGRRVGSDGARGEGVRPRRTRSRRARRSPGRPR